MPTRNLSILAAVVLFLLVAVVSGVLISARVPFNLLTYVMADQCLCDWHPDRNWDDLPGLLDEIEREGFVLGERGIWSYGSARALVHIKQGAAAGRLLAVEQAETLGEEDWIAWFWDEAMLPGQRGYHHLIGTGSPGTMYQTHNLPGTEPSAWWIGPIRHTRPWVGEWPPGIRLDPVWSDLPH